MTESGKSVFVVIAFWGEYESYTEEVRGAYSVEEDALAAIPDMKEAAERSWAAYEGYRKREKDFLESSCTPTHVYPPGTPFPSGHKSYANADHKAAKSAAGDEPTFWVPDVDGYRIEEIPLNAVDPSRCRVVADDISPPLSPTKD